MVLIAFQPEITRFDLLQPLRLVLTSLGKRRHTVADDQLRRFQRLALELLVEHVQVVFIHMGIADEVGEPARCIAGQAAEQRQQRRAFGEVERRAQRILPTVQLHISKRNLAISGGLVMCRIIIAQYANKIKHLARFNPQFRPAQATRGLGQSCGQPDRFAPT